MYRCLICGNNRSFKTRMKIDTETTATYDKNGCVISYDDSAPHENIDFEEPFECSECGSTEIEGAKYPEQGDDEQCVIVHADEGFVRDIWLIAGRANAIQVAKNMAANISFGPDESLVVEIPATDPARGSSRILTIDGRDYQ